MLTVRDSWENLFHGQAKAALETRLPGLLITRRWFGGKAHAIRSARIVESVSIPSRSTASVLLFIQVEYEGGSPETYTLPLAAAFGEQAARIRRDVPQAVVAPLRVRAQAREATGVLYEALWHPDVARALFEAIGQGARLGGGAGTLVASATAAYEEMNVGQTVLTPSMMSAEQSNTSVVFGKRAILKLYRRLEHGINPDLEIGWALTSLGFAHVPPVAGSVEYHGQGGEPITLAILQGFVPNQGDAWRYTREALVAYCEQVSAGSVETTGSLRRGQSPLALSREGSPAPARRLLGPYLESVGLLGRRTAELHLALASVREAAFRPEPLTAEYLRARYESMCHLTDQVVGTLRTRLRHLPRGAQVEARRLLAREPDLRARFAALTGLKSEAGRIRCHGDYHLGQVLYTGTDFVVIDFEGEPARPLRERRSKHAPFLDVAGMLRSFHYASHAVLSDRRAQRFMIQEGPARSLEDWLGLWYGWVGAQFLRAYRDRAEQAVFWPRSEEEVRVLLDVHLLEKAVYELGYELNNRPDWVRIPLLGITQTLDASG